MGLVFSQSDLPPLRPLCGEAPGRDSNPGRADLVAGTLTIRPPHLAIIKMGKLFLTVNTEESQIGKQIVVPNFKLQSKLG